MTGADPTRSGRDPGIREIQSDIERTRGQLDDTVNPLADEPDAKVDVVDNSRAAAKPSLAVVASVAGATVVGIVWWRRRSGRHRG